MIRSTLFLLLLFFAFSAKSQVIFIDSLKNLGDVRAGETRKVEYRVKNNFLLPMILEILPSCICQQLDTAVYELPPKSTTVIHFYLNTFGMGPNSNSSLKVSMHDTSNHISGEAYIYYTLNIVKWQPKVLSGEGICAKFMQVEKNSGDIRHGNSQNYIFEFQNCGNDTLYISDVGLPETWTGSFSRHGILPFKKGSIIVNTSTRTRKGEFTYLIPVSFLSKGKTFRSDLTVKGNVIE